jgi:UDP:flavonoid glycosyltransferase YjiC (YdhE family)
MVVVPITADQPYNAERAAASGAGRIVDPANRTPGEITAAVREVLTDPPYRNGARRLRAEMAALPGPAHMVQLLESICASAT